MKEKNLIKNITDEMMPDLEKIRENCINQEIRPQNRKVISIRNTRIIAVAAICSVLLLSIAVAFAREGGVFSPKKQESTVPSTHNKIEEVVTQNTLKSNVYDNKKDVKGENSGKKSSYTQKNKTDKYLQRIRNSNFSVNWLYDLGKIEDYHICFAGDDTESNYNCNYIIGEYNFYSAVQYCPYGLGLYVVGKEQSYTLADAWENDVIPDLESVVELIENYENDDVELNWIIEKDNEITNIFKNYFYNNSVMTFADLGEADNCRIYYNITDEFISQEKQLKLGSYNFIMSEVQSPYDLGLYVVSEGNIYTLSEAYEGGIITDISEVLSTIYNDGNRSIDYHFTVSEEIEENPDKKADVQNQTEVTVP